jgi:hypothetical protein
VRRAEEYLRRGDSSRWIADVFGDHALARELRGYGRADIQSGSNDALDAIVAAVKSRYELTEENGAVVSP